MTLPGWGHLQHPAMDWGGSQPPPPLLQATGTPSTSCLGCGHVLITWVPPGSGGEEAPLEWGVTPSTGRQPPPQTKHF